MRIVRAFLQIIIIFALWNRRYDEMNWNTGVCKASETCIGGYARDVETVRMLQRLRSNPIYLNGGDNFAGTIWYSVGRWNVTSHFLNLHNADVIVRI